MASKLDSDDDDLIADINVTPLVDITLVLLIIFMVTATYIVSPAIKVDLPKAATGEQTEQSALAIVLDKESRLYLNGQPVTEDALRAAVTAAKAQKADVQALISADQAVSHGAVIHLIDLVKRAGVSRFALNIDPAVAAGAPSLPAPVGGSSP